MKSKSNDSLKARFVIGIIGMVVFGILLLIVALNLLIFSALFYILLPFVVVFAVVFILSWILMYSGLKRKQVISRLSRYMAELTGRNDVVSMLDMAQITGYLPMQIRNDMRMLKRLNLSFDLYTDKGETTLIRGNGAYEQYIETERQRVAFESEKAERESRLKNPETATLEVFRSESAAILDKLRAANLVLPGEEISNSLYELERTAKRIFDHIERYPEKQPETRKLMNYHMPTTLKLIDKYCQYDTMDYQPQNVAEAKADIEKALAAANEAFANFLEKLYHEDTLDVTTDAEVLTKMFEKDGLTGNQFDIGGDKR